MWSYIEPSELKEILLTQSKKISQRSDSDSDDLVNSRVAILDVRDDDFPPTKIVGASNIPSEEWGDDGMIDSLIDKLVKNEKVKMIVLHCMMSQVRGPFCAQRLAARLSCTSSAQDNNTTEMEDGTPRGETVQVRVLRGGFQIFNAKYGDSNEEVFFVKLGNKPKKLLVHFQDEELFP